MNVRPPQRPLRTASPYTATLLGAVILGTAGVLGLLVQGEWLAAMIGAAGALALRRYGAALAGSPPTRTLWAVVALAYALRLAAMAAVALAFAPAGRAASLGGGDDLAYQDLAWRLAQHFHGIPVYIGWVSEWFLLGPWVFAQAALLYVVGPQFAAIKAMNVLAATATILVVHRITHDRFGSRAATLAAVAVGFAPSLVLWSIVDLRETPVMLGVVACVAAIDRLGRTSQPLLGAAIGLLSFAIVAALRSIIASALAVLAALAIGLRDGHAIQNVARAVLVLLAAAAILAVVSVPVAGPPRVADPSLTLAERRSYGALFARSALVVPASAPWPPVAGRPGDRFLVWDIATEDPEAPVQELRLPDLSPSGRTVEITAPVWIVLDGDAASAETRVAHRDLVVVSGAPPSDDVRLIVIGARGARAGADPAAYRRRLITALPTAERRLADAAETAAYLPVGLAHAVAAPYLWTASTGPERAAAVESIAFLVALALAIRTCWSARARWRELILPAGSAAGLLVALAVAEGNAGTLFRHRSLCYPFVLGLAAPSALAWWDRWSSWWVSRKGPVLRRADR